MAIVHTYGDQRAVVMREFAWQEMIDFLHSTETPTHIKLILAHLAIQTGLKPGENHGSAMAREFS